MTGVQTCALPISTPKQQQLTHLLKILPIWKDIEVEVIYDDWKTIPYIENKIHLDKLLEVKPKNWEKVVDYSIFTVFKKDLLSKFRGSSFLKNKLVEINQTLPKEFIVIAPNSVMRSQGSRKDIDQLEWKNIVNYLSQTDQYAVVLEIGRAHV